jgi:hypothetical protein
MKIVRERLLEIKRGFNTPLSALGAGRKKVIEQWCEMLEANGDIVEYNSDGNSIKPYVDDDLNIHARFITIKRQYVDDMPIDINNVYRYVSKLNCYGCEIKDDEIAQSDFNENHIREREYQNKSYLEYYADVNVAGPGKFVEVRRGFPDKYLTFRALKFIQAAGPGGMHKTELGNRMRALIYPNSDPKNSNTGVWVSQLYDKNKKHLQLSIKKISSGVFAISDYGNEYIKKLAEEFNEN